MATQKQRKTAEKLVENRGSVSAAMRDAGYTAASAKNPKNVTKSKGWQELMDEYLPDIDVAKVHHDLLNAMAIEHMVFPLAVSDDEIRELLAEVNCKARKFQHGDSGTHVWYWTADNAARKAAVEMAYKLKGRLQTKVDVTSGGEGIFGQSKLTIEFADAPQAEPDPGSGAEPTS